jgi:hypothetical protein
VRLVSRLQELGFDITLAEAEARGRGMTGRPHFAQIMVEKGYVSNLRQAFDDYLDESAKGYVDRNEPELRLAIRRIAEAGGVSSIAHPVRLGFHDPARLVAMVADMSQAGLSALEVYHSDHRPADTAQYLELAREFGLGVSGGSDFHGDVKPNVRLGVGAGNLNIPKSVLDRLRELRPAAS